MQHEDHATASFGDTRLGQPPKSHVERVAELLSKDQTPYKLEQSLRH